MHPLISETWVEAHRADLIDEARRQRRETPWRARSDRPGWRVRAGRRLMRVGQRLAGEEGPAPVPRARVA